VIALDRILAKRDLAVHRLVGKSFSRHWRQDGRAAHVVGVRSLGYCTYDDERTQTQALSSDVYTISCIEIPLDWRLFSRRCLATTKYNAFTLKKTYRIHLSIQDYFSPPMCTCKKMLPPNELHASKRNQIQNSCPIDTMQRNCGKMQTCT